MEFNPEKSIGYPSHETPVIARIKIRRPITESEFIDNYEDIARAARTTRGWQNWNRSKYGYSRMEDNVFPILPYVDYNEWADPKKMSDELKLFLKLKGENVD
jgi:hypothetical protein